MKRPSILRVLMVGTLLTGMTVSLPRVAWTQEPSPWKDRAEYDAFNAMVQATDPNQRIQLADKYLAAYPETKFRDKVFEFQLQAYQQLNRPEKVEEIAGKLLEINPKHFPALYMLSYLIPRTIQGSGSEMEEKLNRVATYAQKGLEQLAALPKPEALSEADFQKQKQQSEATFRQAVGFASLQKKEYERAAEELRKSAELNPNDALGFYWLGLAYLSPKPPNYEQGIWAMARAVSITGPTALPGPTQTQVKDYVTKVYEARHGSTDDFAQIMTQAASAPFPPPDFHVATAEETAPPPAPEPVPEPARELTVKPEELSTFDVIEKYLSGGGQKGEDTWQLLKGSSLALPGKVIRATPQARPKTVLLAVSPELAQQEGKHDVELTLTEPLAKPLAAGQTVQFEGIADSYKAKPFLLQLKDGKITP